MGQRKAEVFDEKGFMDRLEGDLSVARQVVEIVSGSLVEDAKKASAAWEAGERETARKAAHTVKGVAGTVGGEAAREAAFEAERVLREGGDAAESLAEMVRQVEILMSRLKTWAAS